MASASSTSSASESKPRDLNKEFHTLLDGGRGKDYAKLVELVQLGANVNERAPYSVPVADYRSALAQAVRMHNYGLVCFLIDLGADVNQLTRLSGWFPLHCAVSSYYSEPMGLVIAEKLLAHGADPYLSPLQTTGKGDNETPLEFAIRLNKPEMVRLFLEYAQPAQLVQA